MRSRTAILDRIRRNKPAPVSRPEVPHFASSSAPDVEAFKEMVVAIGGRVEVVQAVDAVAEVLAAVYPGVEPWGSAVPAVPGTWNIDTITDPHELAGMGLYVCEGELGIVENGAIWLSDDTLPHRAAPFITQHLAIVLPVDRLVHDLHEAYDRIAINATGYGILIAGPSKTADIEQALVIGAHGPRSLTVVLVQP